MSFDLLSHVQPEGGLYAIIGIRDGKPRQQLVESREEADALIGMYLAQKRDVFFGVAKYTSVGGGRKQENVFGLKAFWLDIDCGPTKDYPDQPTGLRALRKFCRTTGLPTPTIVSSGYGLHAYWALEEEISRALWEPVALRLREVCQTQGLLVDGKVFEAARILRVPGTKNFKQATPVDVEVLMEGGAVPFVGFCKTLGTEVPQQRSIFDPNYKSTNAEAAAVSSAGYKFRRLLKRSAEGEGCAQIAHWVTNAATAGYNEWFYTLSVAANCEDAGVAVHVVSRGHPDYDPEAVERKAQTIKKSTSCARFETLEPSLCKGCKFRGKIKSPRQLAYAPSAPVTPTSEEEEPTGELPAILEEDTDADNWRRFLGNPPWPYSWHATEGLEVSPQPDPITGERGPKWIAYQNYLYPRKRIHDRNEGDTIIFHLRLKNDPVREFAVPQMKLLKKEDMKAAFAQWGVTARGKNFDHLLECMTILIEQLQDAKGAETMRQQFGWADGMGRFVLGDQELSAEKNYYSPPSRVTQKLAKFIHPKGELAKWKEVWSLYGLPGMEPHAFAALSAFGAPLLKFFNQTGAVINLYNPRSGTGKTTILNAVNSVWGHPKELRLKQDDTMNGRLLWVGILNNLPATMDELTNASASQYSDMLYALSNGKGKERMAASGNELRENNTTWQTITVSTANASFTEKLSVIKDRPEGELMRLFEYPIGLVQLPEKVNAKELFDRQLMENYGHAGPIFIRYILENLEWVQEICTQMQARIDEEMNLLPKERYWSATIAANIVGGIIARKLGLIDWKVAKVYEWACGQVNRMRYETIPEAATAQEIIGEFVNKNIDNILVINDGDARSGVAPIPSRWPRGELKVRIEPNTELMFISVKALREFCVNSQVSYADTVRELKERGIYVKSELKRLGKGLPGVGGGPVQALHLRVDTSLIEDLTVTPPEGEATVEA